MEKIREYKYDNFKFLLIFLVVFGHLLELHNVNILYVSIYMFHMPMFIYISGYFTKGNLKSVINKLYIYVIWETIYYLFYKYVLNNNLTLNYLKAPIWILWYIFALIAWELIMIIVNIFKRKKAKHFKEINSLFCYGVLAVSFIASIMSSFINNIGYDYCLSRIITFFPYFLIGYFQKNYNFNLFEMKSKTRKSIYKILSFFIMAVISISYFVLLNNQIQGRWLYGSYSYANGGYTWTFKTMWILLSLSVIFLLNNIIPNKKIMIISKLGSNTLIIYLVHGIIIKFMGKYSSYIFQDNSYINITIYLGISVLLIIVLGNDLIKKCLTFVTNIIKILNRISEKNKKRMESSYEY